MGRHYSFKPGSFYRADDRTGFPQRAERTRKQWNGLIVDESVWEPRQPQDLVKGLKDQQSVQDARPLSPAQFVGPVYVQLAANVPPRAVTAELQSLAYVAVGDELGILMDDGAVWRVIVLSMDATTSSVTVAPPILLNASIDNEVINYRQSVGQ